MPASAGVALGKSKRVPVSSEMGWPFLSHCTATTPETGVPSTATNSPAGTVTCAGANKFASGTSNSRESAVCFTPGTGVDAARAPAAKASKASKVVRIFFMMKNVKWSVVGSGFGRVGVDEPHDFRNAIRGKAAQPRVLANRLLVRRDIEAVSLVAAHVAV